MNRDLQGAAMPGSIRRAAQREISNDLQGSTMTAAPEGFRWRRRRRRANWLCLFRTVILSPLCIAPSPEIDFPQPAQSLRLTTHSL